MVKVTNGGITMVVAEAELDFYKRAGYLVVKDETSGLEAEKEKAPKVKRVKAADTEPTE